MQAGMGVLRGSIARSIYSFEVCGDGIAGKCGVTGGGQETEYMIRAGAAL
jgi:hypothetical protein